MRCLRGCRSLVCLLDTLSHVAGLHLRGLCARHDALITGDCR